MKLSRMDLKIRLAVVLVVGALVGLVAQPAVGSPVPFERGEWAPHWPQGPQGQQGIDGYLDIPDSQLRQVTAALVDLVRRDPWKDNAKPPLVFIDPVPEDDDRQRVTQPGPGPNPDEYDDIEANNAEAHNAVPAKRSRYYRRYPWKRVNRTRGSYDPDQYNMCSPSREDVLQLLVGLHRARAGETGRTIQFCNRKRPASSVFTNIRFIG